MSLLRIYLLRKTLEAGRGRGLLMHLVLSLNQKGLVSLVNALWIFEELGFDVGRREIVDLYVWL